jgi:hypothetical protein
VQVQFLPIAFFKRIFMSNKYNQQSLDIINRCAMAYFLYVLEKNDFNILDYRPTCGSTLELVGKHLNLANEHPHQLNAVTGKIVVHDKNLIDLQSKRIEDFFDDDFHNEIEKSAKEFIGIMKDHPDSDVIFSYLPDCPPFLSSCFRDCETDLIMRTIYGQTFAMPQSTFVFDYDYLIVTRLREVEPHPVYGTSYMPVSQMTAQQRKKFDVQPKQPEEEEC